MTTLFKKYTTLATLITTLLLLATWYTTNPILGTLAYVLYIAFFGYSFGICFIKQENSFWKLFFGTIGLIAVTTSLLSIIYWFYQIDQATISFTFIFTSITISYLCRKNTIEDFIIFKKKQITTKQISDYLKKNILAIIIFIGQITILTILISHRYDETIISPWTLFSNKIFILFFLVSALLLFFLQRSKNQKTNLLLIILHTAIILNVAFFVFKYGYGFDPHVHEATEKWIREHLFIAPKQPYYIGQYMWVVSTNFITKLNISWLDRSIVPILASVAIPLCFYFALTKNNFKNKIYPALLLISLIPLNFFIFTTPNNLALLISLITTSWIWYENKHSDIQTNIFGVLLNILTTTIHPLIGLPIFVIYLASIIYKKIYANFKKIFYPLYILILTFTVPFALYLNSIFNKGSLIWQNTFQNAKVFFNIFARPQYIFIERGPKLLKLLYYYRDILKPLIIIIIIFGIFLALKKYKQNITYFFISTFLALTTSSFLIITSIKFKDVISYDQKLYGTRLLDLSLILFLPFFIIAIREIFIKLKNKISWQILVSIFLALSLLLSWFFTYPTRDNISLYTGQNLRKADLIAVKFIVDRNNNKKDYIVLTNQAVATAALTEFGFDGYLPTSQGLQYFYSIPTGGPLYQYFRQMAYVKAQRQPMEEAMKFAGVRKAYFIHTDYWSPAAQIRDDAKVDADNWWELDNGRVWVYEYILQEEE
ncbi:MAG: hypothetical protein WC025_00840 [Candidatus Magasanikbacteria bacterium]